MTSVAREYSTSDDHIDSLEDIWHRFALHSVLIDIGFTENLNDSFVHKRRHTRYGESCWQWELFYGHLCLIPIDHHEKLQNFHEVP